MRLTNIYCGLGRASILRRVLDFAGYRHACTLQRRFPMPPKTRSGLSEKIAFPQPTIKWTMLLLLGAAMIQLLSGCGRGPAVIPVEANPVSLAVDPRGEHLYVACQGSRHLIAWDLKKKKRTAMVTIGPGADRLYIDRNQSRLVLLDQKDKKILYFTYPQLSLTKAQPLAEVPSAWTEDPQTRLQYVAQRERDLIQPYLDSHTMPVIPIGLGPADMVIQPDTNLLWCANEKANEVAVADLTSNLVLKRIHVWANPHRLVFSPLGDKLFVLCIGRDAVPSKSVIQSIDLDYQTAGLTWALGPKVRHVAMDPKQRFLFTAGQEDVKIISLDTGIILRRIKLAQPANALALSPDGERLYVACQGESMVRLFPVDREHLIGK